MRHSLVCAIMEQQVENQKRKQNGGCSGRKPCFGRRSSKATSLSFPQPARFLNSRPWPTLKRIIKSVYCSRNPTPWRLNAALISLRSNSIKNPTRSSPSSRTQKHQVCCYMCTTSWLYADHRNLTFDFFVIFGIHRLSTTNNSDYVWLWK